MKHIRLLTTLVLLVLAGRTHADNLSVGKITMAPGEAKQINIALTNSDRKYAAFQFDLQLPEGITIAKDDNNKLIASLDNSRKADHSFTISDLGDNKYRLLAYSMTNSAFLGTNGAIVNISVISDAAITDGTNEAKLKAQIFTDANGNQYNLDDIAFNIEIVTPVNDKLSVADITMPAEGKKQIEIALNNSDRNYAAFQFDMELPDGLTILKDGNDKFVASLNTGRISDHSLTVSKLSGNVYRVLSYSMTNAEITGSNGALINISINSAEDIDDGQYVAKLKSLVFTDASGKQYNLTDATFNISIVTPVITAENKTREYGLDNPEFTFTSSMEITGTPELTTTATKTSSVGNYDIVVNKGTVEGRITGVKGTLTITTKTVSNPSITLSETSYTYDGTAKKPTVTVKDGETTIPSTEYSVSYTNNTNVGTATVTITDVEGGNYAVSGSTTFTISSADGSLTAPTAKSDLVYNGAAQELINAGSTTTGTLEYSLDGTTYAETIPQGTNAGSYTVYYKVTGDANHNDITAQNFQVTIAAKTVDSPSITLSETSYTYDGSAKEPAVTLKDGETTIPATEYSVSYTNNTNVGTATVTITDVEGGNYAVSGSTTFAISSADGSLNPPVGKSDLVYNGTAQDLITAGSTTTGTMEYSLDGTTYAETIPQGTNAGSYTVYYKVIGDANHNDIAAQNFQVTIAAKTVDSPSITLSETSYTYDGNAKEPTVTVKDGETTIPATEYSVSYTNNTNVGTATVTITDVEGGNYAVSGSTTFTISVADGSLTAPTGKNNLVYNGTAQDLITAGSTTTGTLEYSLDGTTYAENIPQGTNAGSYTVYYKVTGDANHNDIAAQHFDVKIAKATLSVSVGDYEMTEGESIPSFTISYDGFVNNETVAVLTSAPTASCEATSESKPDTYAITISGGVADNYSFSYTAGTLTIKTKNTFVDDNSGSSEGEDDNSAEYTINESSGGEGEENTVAITSDEGVKGSFAIPETVEHNGTSYMVTEIGESAFENNKELTDVSIPSSITAIGDKAFKGCSNLKSITVNITTPISFSVPAATRRMMTRTDGSSVFDGVDKATCILYVPEGSVDLYKAAPVWCEFKSILAIGSTGIKDILMTDGEAHDVYNLQGRKVKAKATSLEGLPRGVYVVKGKKISIN